jgi:hypothetical protein
VVAAAEVAAVMARTAHCLPGLRIDDPPNRQMFRAWRGAPSPRFWIIRAAEFSHWMLNLLPASQPGTAGAAFHEGLRQARLARLMSDKGFARPLALAYVGIDP